MHSQTTRRPIAVVLGTGSAAVRLASVVRILGDQAFLIGLGQQPDGSARNGYHGDLSLPSPHVQLDGWAGRGRSVRIAAAVTALTRMFEAQRSVAVIVQGDTDYASAGAEAAHRCGIPVIHVEAGLRSHGGRAMPEEQNRRIVPVLADVHCAATPLNAANLIAENTDPKRIGITGSTVVEAALSALPTRADSLALLTRLDLTEEEFILAAIDRPDNTDEAGRLETILRELVSLPLPVVLPAHPRTDRLIKRHRLDGLARRLHRTMPIDHADFLGLARHARLLISDHDAVQEECTVVKRPLLVVRESTERPEAIQAGFATLVPAGPQITQVAQAVLDNVGLRERLTAVRSPYGDGKASWRIGLLALAIRHGVPAVEATATVCISPREALQDAGIEVTWAGSDPSKAAFPPG